MDVFIAVLGILAIYSSAFLLGKGLSKVRLPAILGWLIAGMALGPCLGGLVSQEAVDSAWYKSCIKLLEGLAGVMIGAEVIFKDLKKCGAKTIVITLFQSLGTFLTVSAAFLAAFSIAGKPLYVAFIFGGSPWHRPGARPLRCQAVPRGRAAHQDPNPPLVHRRHHRDGRLLHRHPPHRRHKRRPRDGGVEDRPLRARPPAHGELIRPPLRLPFKAREE